MAPATQLGLVLLATSSVVLAARGGHAQHHIHKRQSRYPGTAPTAPFGYGNGTQTAYPTGTGRGTRTRTNKVTETVYQTVTIPGQGSGSGDVPVGGQAVAPTCGGTVTVTDSVTVTVTPGASSSAAATGATSEGVSPEAYPVTETTFTARSEIPTVTVTSKVQAATGKHGNAPAPAKSSHAAPAPAPAPSKGSSPAPAAPPAYSPPKSSAAASSAPAPSSSSAPGGYGGSSGSSSGGKRGCLYQGTNDAGCQALAAAGAVSWSTNWAPTPGQAIDKCTYQPQLWGPGSDHTNGFTDAAKKAISNGATVVLGFNEPDRTDQSGLDAKSAAPQLWNQYIKPLGGNGVKLVSPGVTSQVEQDGSIRGINWLKDFQNVGKVDWDITGVHFYANCANPNLGLENNGELSYLKKMVDTASSTFNKDVWVTEFGCYEGTPTDQIANFYKVAIPYLEGESKVKKYAGFKADLLASGSTLNAAGKAYAGQS